jgi:hypothetical protein
MTRKSKIIFRLLQTSFSLIIAFAIFGAPNALAKKGGGGNGGVGGGEPDPDFTAESLDPLIPAIDSYSLDSGEQIVFRNAQMDLSQFVGSDSNGACNHGFKDGTLVLKPKSTNNPAVATLVFWFKSDLESGSSVMHRFAMEGEFDQAGDWVPSTTNPVANLTFNDWEVAAENRKAQKQDCAGNFQNYPDGSWTVTVTRQP